MKTTRRKLSTLAQSIARLMKRGDWWTLKELANLVGHGEATVSARLRELREFGFEIRKRPTGIGREREYRLKT